MPPTRRKLPPPRAVLDTRLVLSALVFAGSAKAVLRVAWTSHRFTPLASRATTGELIRVLAYPKFGLATEEREDLLSDYLLFCETINVPSPWRLTPNCLDPVHESFLQLAIAGQADVFVTADPDLLALSTELSCSVVVADHFMAKLGSA